MRSGDSPFLQVKLDAEEVARLETLKEKVVDYQSDMDFNLVYEAYKLVKPPKKQNSEFKPTLKDTIANDPLLLPESLVSDLKPELETILAAILYPWARPTSNKVGPTQANCRKLSKDLGVRCGPWSRIR